MLFRSVAAFFVVAAFFAVTALFACADLPTDFFAADFFAASEAGAAFVEADAAFAAPVFAAGFFVVDVVSLAAARAAVFFAVLFFAGVVVRDGAKVLGPFVMGGRGECRSHVRPAARAKHERADGSCPTSSSCGVYRDSDIALRRTNVWSGFNVTCPSVVAMRGVGVSSSHHYKTHPVAAGPHAWDRSALGPINSRLRPRP